MKHLYPTIYKEFTVSDKEETLNRIQKHKEYDKKFRLIFSDHKSFEGQVKFDGFNIKYIGETARNYKVELEGEMIENGQNCQETRIKNQSLPRCIYLGNKNQVVIVNGLSPLQGF